MADQHILVNDIDNSISKLSFGQSFEVRGEIPLDIRNGAYLTVIRYNSNPVHSLGNPYPAKFIPELPRWAIKKYSNIGNTVLDPFVGSGTTMVEARLLGRNCFGIDHNPLARLLSKVKCTPLDKNCLLDAHVKLIRSIQSHKFDKNVQTPSFKNKEFWFDRSASEAIAIIKSLIDPYEVDVRDFFMVVLSEVVQKVSNVALGQVLPAARINHYSKQSVNRADVFQLFYEQLKKDIPLILSFSSLTKYNCFSTVIGDDARGFSIPSHIDIVITSPPYINAHHYIWAHKLRLLQLGMINDEERVCLMKKEIGTEELGVKMYSSLHNTGIDEIDKKISQIYNGTFYKASKNQNKIRAASVYRYFIDMKLHFVKIYNILKEGSRYCMVMGDNTVCKVKIPTAEYLSFIAEKVGFNKIFQFQIILKNRTLNLPRNVGWASTIPYDRMVVFEK